MCRVASSLQESRSPVEPAQIPQLTWAPVGGLTALLPGGGTGTVVTVMDVGSVSP